jgi:hypothetical protein
MDFLRKLHFVAADSDGIFRPTVSGVLFATEHPEIYLPSAFIQAVCYRGTERNANDQLDARDITGPLDVQIADACRFVERNMKVAAVKKPARIDIPQYAMNAVFEAIVNAVAHRDYSIAESKIRLHMFSDRFEIFSPGGLPNSLTIEEIGERQFSRNELICTCLSRCSSDRSLVGIGGVAIIAVMLLPTLLSLISSSLAFLLASGVAEMLGCDTEGKLISELGSIYAVMIAVVAMSAVMFIFALTVFSRTAVALG